MNAKYDSVVPGPKNFEGGEVEAATANAGDAGFVRDVNARLAEYRELMDGTKLRGGLATVMLVSARGNQYLQDSGLDNALFAGQPERCARVLLNAINLIYILSVLVHPFMPATSTQILEQLNAPPRSLPLTFFIDILPGHTLHPAQHLFKKIENLNGVQEKAWQKQFGGDAIIAHETTPSGPGGHPEGGVVPSVKDVKLNDAGQRKAAQDAKILGQRAKKKAAEANKTAEERELEAKIEAQGARLRALKMGQETGDVEGELAVAKGLKSELADLRKKLKENGAAE